VGWLAASMIVRFIGTGRQNAKRVQEVRR